MNYVGHNQTPPLRNPLVALQFVQVRPGSMKTQHDCGSLYINSRMPH